MATPYGYVSQRKAYPSEQVVFINTGTYRFDSSEFPEWGDLTRFFAQHPEPDPWAPESAEALPDPLCQRILHTAEFALSIERSH